VYSYVFKRYELKYLLNPDQYVFFLKAVRGYLQPDKYGETTIQSLYYDTDDYRIIRASIEKPVFKEKIRLRCYGLNDSNKNVFLEMKRKYEGVVYKRRISMKEGEENKYFDTGKHEAQADGQIGNELRYFTSLYGSLKGKALILYDRCAYFDPDSELRVTFDRNIRYRTEELNFHTSLEGKPILAPGFVLMEIKTGTSIPLWLCRLLSESGAPKSSFSKYGAVYANDLINKI